MWIWIESWRAMSGERGWVAEVVGPRRVQQTPGEHVRWGPQKVHFTVNPCFHLALLLLLVMVDLPGYANMHRVPFTGFLNERKETEINTNQDNFKFNIIFLK